MVGRRLLWALLALLLSACSRKEPVAPDTSEAADLSDLEYSVLAAIVDSVHHRSADSIIIVQDSTDSGLFGRRNPDSLLTLLLDHASQYLPGLTQETGLDFKTKNLARTFVGRPSRIHPGCVRTSSTTRLYPLMSVGRVGFDASRAQALAYVGYMEGVWAGSGELYLVAREGQGWRIMGVMVVWIS